MRTIWPVALFAALSGLAAWTAVFWLPDSFQSGFWLGLAMGASGMTVILRGVK